MPFRLTLTPELLRGYLYIIVVEYICIERVSGDIGDQWVVASMSRAENCYDYAATENSIRTPVFSTVEPEAMGLTIRSRCAKIAREAETTARMISASYHHREALTRLLLGRR